MSSDVTRGRVLPPSEGEDGKPALTSVDIQKLMEDARRQIEQRKKMMMASAPQPIVGPVPLHNPALMVNHVTPGVPVVPPTQIATKSEEIASLEHRSRIAQLQAQINARLAASKSFATTSQVDSGDQTVIATGTTSKPTPLRLNAEGRTVDDTGREIQLIQRMPTLKANIRAQTQKKEVIRIKQQEKSKEEEPPSKFLDPRVQAKGVVRTKRTFQFHEKGEFEQLAKKLRLKAHLDHLQKEIAEKAKKTGISAAARLAQLSAIVPKKETLEEDIPDVEWWDSFVMKDSTYEESIDNPSDDKYEGITHLIEHPMQMKPPTEPTKPVYLPAFLTKKEKKKKRRQDRREAWKEKQEKIRLGLEPPPEPKMKISNMMRILGSQAVQDPTKIEAMAREQMEKRKRAHEEANAARKLTLEQKRQKKVKKIKEDTNLGIHVAVYRITDLHNPAKKFKIEMNAKQLLMTGVIVLYRNVNVVAVEGGPKQQRKFKRLMLSRIKWSEDMVSKDGTETGEKVPNKCDLVWEGLAKSRIFHDIKVKISPNESFARELFKNHGVEQYWDLSFSMTVIESSKDP